MPCSGPGPRSAEQLIEELRTALPSDQLAMHYQPLVDMGRVVDMGREEPRFPAAEGPYGVEALLRSRLPRRGLLTAGAFMDTAGRAGLLPALGGWGMRTACRQMVLWDAALGAFAHRVRDDPSAAAALTAALASADR